MRDERAERPFVGAQRLFYDTVNSANDRRSSVITFYGTLFRALTFTASLRKTSAFSQFKNN